MNEQLPLWAQWVGLVVVAVGLVVSAAASAFAAWAVIEAKAARREAADIVTRERRLDHQIGHLTRLGELLATQGPNNIGWIAHVRILFRAAMLEPGELPILRAVFDLEPPESANEALLAAIKAVNPDSQATGVKTIGIDGRWEHFGEPGYKEELLQAIRDRGTLRTRGRWTTGVAATSGRFGSMLPG